MPSLRIWATLLFATYSLADSTTYSSSVPVVKKQASSSLVRAIAHHRKHGKQTNQPASEHSDYYWFANYTVGEASNLDILLDTGSFATILDKGFYKPTKYARPSNPSNFSFTYEGVNADGTGFETINGTNTLDVVKLGNVGVTDQMVGSVTSYIIVDAPPKPEALMGDGIIGLGIFPPALHLPPSWPSSLCASKAVKECRFGLAFGTNHKGDLIVGDVDRKLFRDELTVAPLFTEYFPGWSILGDVSFNDKLHWNNQTLVMDSGTPNMQAPLQIAKQIFDAIGYKYVLDVSGPDPEDPSVNTTFLTGFFPCDKPPSLTFSFPAESVLRNPPKNVTISKHSKTYSLLGSEWNVQNNGNNNCTAVLAGTNVNNAGIPHSDFWLLGQPFMQGHYVDFNFGAPSMGFADLDCPEKVAGS